MATPLQQTGNIKPFEGTGYTFWKHRIKLVLEQSRVVEVLTQKPPAEGKDLDIFKLNDVKARNIITQCLADNVLESVMDKSTAKEIMDTLDSTYIKKGISRQVDLQRKLRTFQFKSGSLKDFINTFENTVNEIKSSGGNVSDAEVMTLLLSSMPETYDAVTRAIDIVFSKNPEDVNLNYVKNALLQEELRKKEKVNSV